MVRKNRAMKYNSKIGQKTGILNTLKNVMKKAITVALDDAYLAHVSCQEIAAKGGPALHTRT